MYSQLFLLNTIKYEYDINQLPCTRGNRKRIRL